MGHGYQGITPLDKTSFYLRLQELFHFLLLCYKDTTLQDFQGCSFR
jgi:hypothetical protein